MNWEIFIASFTGSLIELVEILGVVLVVGRVAGWRNALIGASGGIGLTLIVSLLLGKSLMLIPINYLQLVAGAFLLAFGQAWTRSVVKYYGGIPKRGKDEEEELQAELEQQGKQPGWNWVAIVAAFKSSLLESVEIAIAVVALGAAGGKWLEAISGAGVATVGLILFAFLLRAPLNQVPVKLMKFVAAMLLMGFGTYWLGEGLNIEWLTGNWAIAWLPLVWGLLMASAAMLLRWRLRTPTEESIG